MQVHFQLHSTFLRGIVVVQRPHYICGTITAWLVGNTAGTWSLRDSDLVYIYVGFSSHLGMLQGCSALFFPSSSLLRGHKYIEGIIDSGSAIQSAVRGENVNVYCCRCVIHQDSLSDALLDQGLFSEPEQDIS